MGDPAGIGPRVLLECLAQAGNLPSVSIIGDLSWLKSIARRHHLSVAWNRFHWIDCANVPAHLHPGQPQPSAGRAAYEYLVEAVRLIKAGEAEALVTAPVSKQAIVEAGIRWIGHTEFLAESFGCRTRMMFVVRNFRASLVTTHVGLRQLPAALTPARVRETLKATREALIRDFKIRSPRIGLAALNPHAGENGIFGGEEKKILAPALQGIGFRVQGPLPVDSLMQAAAQGAYDAVVALYHDQALIAVKLLGWEEAVNVTLGLPFIRTSPVHGTAFDLVTRGSVRPEHSLRQRTWRPPQFSGGRPPTNCGGRTRHALWRGRTNVAQGRPDSRSMQSAIRLAVQLSRRRASA